MFRGIIFFLALFSFTKPTFSNVEAQKAYRVHERLACEPPSKAKLAKMEALIKQGKSKRAFKLATQTRGFYECTLKNWCLDQTNEEASKNVPLNDYCATIIGAVRDQIPFDELLWRDIIYVANDDISKKDGIPPYSLEDNKHYEDLEKKNSNLVNVLEKKQQTQVTGFGAASGLLTTRAFAAAFLKAGTNRRAVRHALQNFICTDIEQMQDTTRPDTWVAKDIPRDPGGDPKKYQQECKGCHTGMDALRGAWAHFDFDEENHKYIYQASGPVAKYNINDSNYSDGYQTRDSSWKNMWLEGPNNKFGWPENQERGQGIQSFGRMLSNVKELPVCIAKRTFRTVCMADETTDLAKKLIDDLASGFVKDKYDLRNLFINTASACVGE